VEALVRAVDRLAVWTLDDVLDEAAAAAAAEHDSVGDKLLTDGRTTR